MQPKIHLWSVLHHFMLLLASPHQNSLQEKVTKAFINCGIDDDVATNYTPRATLNSKKC